MECTHFNDPLSFAIHLHNTTPWHYRISSSPTECCFLPFLGQSLPLTPKVNIIMAIFHFISINLFYKFINIEWSYDMYIFDRFSLFTYFRKSFILLSVWTAHSVFLNRKYITVEIQPRLLIFLLLDIKALSSYLFLWKIYYKHTNFVTFALICFG